MQQTAMLSGKLFSKRAGLQQIIFHVSQITADSGLDLKDRFNEFRRETGAKQLRCLLDEQRSQRNQEKLPLIDNLKLNFNPEGERLAGVELDP